MSINYLETCINDTKTPVKNMYIELSVSGEHEFNNARYKRHLIANSYNVSEINTIKRVEFCFVLKLKSYRQTVELILFTHNVTK